MKCAKNANIAIDDFGALHPSSSSRSCMTPLAILTFLKIGWGSKILEVCMTTCPSTERASIKNRLPPSPCGHLLPSP